MTRWRNVVLRCGFVSKGDCQINWCIKWKNLSSIMGGHNPHHWLVPRQNKKRKVTEYFFQNCFTLFFSKAHCHRDTNSHVRHQNFQIFDLDPPTLRPSDLDQAMLQHNRVYILQTTPHGPLTIIIKCANLCNSPVFKDL